MTPFRPLSWVQEIPGATREDLTHTLGHSESVRSQGGLPPALGNWAQEGHSILVSRPPLSLAGRNGQVRGKCPAGYFCPPGTSAVTTPGPREPQHPCSQGQLCAKQCPQGNSPLFLPLGDWKGFPAFPAHLRMRPVSRGNSRRATWVGPQAERAPSSSEPAPPCVARSRCCSRSLRLCRCLHC